MPFGLTSSENLQTYWSNNTRRRIFYSYPNGTAPLTGLLSLTETESTPMPEFGWWEKRWAQISTTTATGPTANNVFYTTGTTTSVGTTFTPTSGTAYRIYLTATSNFQVDDLITIHGLNGTTTSTGQEDTFRLTQVQSTSSPYYVEAVATGTTTEAITNNSATLTVGLRVVYAGTAYAEGSRSRTGRLTFPIEAKNYTQIFKTPFELTRTALKEPLRYDKSGAYADAKKSNGLDHLAGLEWDFLFGQRSSTTGQDPDTGITVPRRTTGGILWWLKQWELGSIAAGGAFDYGQDNVSTQVDFRTYTNKRIIRLAGQTISRTDFNFIEGLVFEKTNAADWCKLCLCGPGYLQRMVESFERSVQKTEMRETQFKGWNFEMVQRTSNAGTIYYKQHPQFAVANSPLRNSALYVDMGHLKYRYLDDSDTDLTQNIQAPDADKRKDQWLTEAGLEVAFPESHMFVDSMGGITQG